MLSLTGTVRSREALSLKIRGVGRIPAPLASVRVGSGARPGAFLYLLLVVGVAPLFFHDGYVGLYPGAHLQIIAKGAELLIDGFDG